jgi:heat shock protein HslJ
MTRALLALALLAALAPGCAADGRTGPSPDAPREVAGFGPPGPGPAGAWLLVEGTGPDGEIPTVEGRRSTLVIEGGDVGGHAACNGFGGGRIDGKRMRFGGLEMTMIGCWGSAGALEDAYLTAVQNADTIRREGDRLVLTGPSTKLTFEYLAPPDLALATGRTLRLTRIWHAGETTGVVRPATLRLDRRSIEGSTGCRSFSGTYVESGDELVVTRMSLDGDLEDCGPREVDQELLVLGVVGDRFRTQVENGGTELTLSAQGGDALLFEDRV